MLLAAWGVPARVRLATRLMAIEGGQDLQEEAGVLQLRTSLSSATLPIRIMQKAMSTLPRGEDFNA